MRGRRKYHYKEWTTGESHKNYPDCSHRYLWMETDEYAVMIHYWAWKQLRNTDTPRRGVDYQHDLERFLRRLVIGNPTGSRVRLGCRAQNETVFDSSLPSDLFMLDICDDFAEQWIARLLRTKNRKREIEKIMEVYSCTDEKLCDGLYEEEY